MNSRVSFLSKLSPDRLMVLVVLLGVSFVAIVLLPGLKLAGDLVNSSAALKWVADQQRYPTIIRASLETMRDRLTNRGYLQESVDQLTDATKKFGDAVQIMTTPRPGGWLGFGMPGSVGDSIAGRPRRPVARCVGQGTRSSAARAHLQQRALCGQRVGGHGAQCRPGGSSSTTLTTAIRISRHSLPELESELTAVGAQLQAGSARAARQLQVVMLDGPFDRRGAGAAHRAAAQRTQQAGGQAQGGAPTDGGHSAHGEGRPVPARRASRHRHGVLERARVAVPAQGSGRPRIRGSAEGHRLGEDAGDGA